MALHDMASHCIAIREDALTVPTSHASRPRAQARCACVQRLQQPHLTMTMAYSVGGLQRGGCSDGMSATLAYGQSWAANLHQQKRSMSCMGCRTRSCMDCRTRSCMGGRARSCMGGRARSCMGSRTRPCMGGRARLCMGGRGSSLGGLWVLRLAGLWVLHPAGLWMLRPAGLWMLHPTGLCMLRPAGLWVLRPAGLLVLHPAGLFQVGLPDNLRIHWKLSSNKDIGRGAAPEVVRSPAR
eukprot:363514-Chlamydomonas_euryale.AAC.5